jgi:hypothetical protein
MLTYEEADVSNVDGGDVRRTSALLSRIVGPDTCTTLNIDRMTEDDLRSACAAVYTKVDPGKGAPEERWMQVIKVGDTDLSLITDALREAKHKYLDTAVGRSAGGTLWHSEDGIPETAEQRREMVQVMAILAAARRGHAEGWSTPLDSLPACAAKLLECAATATSDDRKELRYSAFKPHSCLDGEVGSCGDQKSMLGDQYKHVLGALLSLIDAAETLVRTGSGASTGREATARLCTALHTLDASHRLLGARRRVVRVAGWWRTCRREQRSEAPNLYVRPRPLGVTLSPFLLVGHCRPRTLLPFGKRVIRARAGGSGGVTPCSTRMCAHGELIMLMIPGPVQSDDTLFATHAVCAQPSHTAKTSS